MAVGTDKSSGSRKVDLCGNMNRHHYLWSSVCLRYHMFLTSRKTHTHTIAVLVRKPMFQAIISVDPRQISRVDFPVQSSLGKFDSITLVK